MKQLFLMSFLVFALTNLFAQTEKANYKTIADKFESQYNQDMYDSIFNEFTPGMQTGMPLEKTKAFLTGLKSQAGQITQRTFIKYENSFYASYKAQFEKETFTINIWVTAKGKINGLFVLPCKASDAPIVEYNNTKPAISLELAAAESLVTE